MFERYTEKARRVIFFARYEASQFGSPFIETEHLLLGILREDKRLTNRFLRSQATVASIRKQVENHTNPREKTSTSIDLPLTPESKQVLQYAAEEADQLAHKHIGPEHLFLALLREQKCFAAQILEEHGIRLAEAREEISRSPAELVTKERQQHTAMPDEIGAYVTELTEQTQTLIGREAEVDRLIALLCRYKQTNPVLVGEPGVGKRTIVGGLARRIADGIVPESLAKKHVLTLELPPLRTLDKNSHEKLDRALVTAAEEGKIFFVNLLHDQPGGISPTAWIRGAELLYRPIVAGKIQCISTASPAAFGTLQAERHWLAQYFEPVHVAAADEQTAIKVLQGIKSVYERFHNVSYSDDSITHAVMCARRCIKKGGLPGTAVDVIDESGAAAQLQQGTLPEEVVAARKLMRLALHRMENCIANHEFEKARFYSGEEQKERDNLEQLRKKYKLDENPAWNIRLEDIETAVSKLTGMPIAAIRHSAT